MGVRLRHLLWPIALFVSTGAYAQGAAAAELAFSFSDFSSRISSEASSAQGHATSLSQGLCGDDDDCPHGYACADAHQAESRCVAREYQADAQQPVVPNASSNSGCPSGTVCDEAPAPPESAGCSSEADCLAGYVCRASRCVERPPPPTAPAERCSTDSACGPGRSCAAGQCLASPPPPSSSLQRRGFELYLRERAVQLREELALGSGPVIADLAAARGLSPRSLGRAMRSHRAQLVELIGDGAHPEWAGKFLMRVDELERECGQT